MRLIQRSYRENVYSNLFYVICTPHTMSVRHCLKGVHARAFINGKRSRSRKNVKTLKAEAGHEARMMMVTIEMTWRE